VTNLSSEFCVQLRAARREAGLTQSALAHEVGCKQSALSMFEQGDGTKLNDEVINKLANKFGLKVVTVDETAAKGLAALPSTIYPLPSSSGFCPNPHCPSNHRYQVEERVFYRPDRQAADPIGGKYCAVCGELLERNCPNCGAPVHDGAICSACGDPYIAA